MDVKPKQKIRNMFSNVSETVQTFADPGAPLKTNTLIRIHSNPTNSYENLQYGLLCYPSIHLFVNWTDCDVKSVNTHHTLQCEHPSENDWLPFCPLRLSAVITFNHLAQWTYRVSPCRCVCSISLWIDWQYFQIFITFKFILTSGNIY